MAAEGRGLSGYAWDLPAARPLVRAARPLHWTKNLLLFAGLVFAAQLDDPRRWLLALTAFAAYSLAASAAYLVNDVADVDYDVGHPVKRLRPVASGELGTRAALVAAGVLAAVALALAAALGPASLVLLASFLAVQLAYTMRLKRLVVVDLLVLAALYVFRSAAGALAVDVRLSPWLVACTTLLALFLALQKRRGELLQVGAAGTTGRRALSGYTLQRADGAAAAVLVTTLATYFAYTLVATPPAMVVTVPLVAFGLARYAYLVRRRGLGEEPERILVEDVPLLATIAVWAAVSAAILAHG